MEAPPSPIQPDENWAEQCAQTLSRQRSRFQEFLAAQHRRLARVEEELASQVRQIGEELARDRNQTEQARQSLTQQSEELACQSEALGRLKEELDARQAEWEKAWQAAGRHEEALANKLQERVDELDRRQQEFDARRDELAVDEQELQHARQKLALEQEEHRADVEHLAAARKRLAERLAELDARAETLAAQEGHTQAQRQRIAKEFRARRATHLKELDRRRAELENLAQFDTGQLGRLEQQLRSVQQERDAFQEDICGQRDELDALRRKQEPLDREVAEKGRQLAAQDKQLSALRQRQTELSTELESSRSAEAELTAALDEARRRQATLSTELESSREVRDEENTALEAGRGRLDEMREELEASCRREEELSGQVESLGHRCEELQQSVEADVKFAGEEGDRLKDIRGERDAPLDRLAEAERRLKEAPRENSGSEADRDLRRRHEMAMEDLRELKSENADLEKRLAQHSRAGAGPDDGAMDWEAQKRRMLAALEAESNEAGESGGGDRARAAERLEMEEVIRSTDEALAARDREIEEMRQLLKNQSENLGSVAVGAAALGEVLDQDDIIREQREHLRRLEEEWKEKLRQAEIDISIERAKIGRERAELDGRLQASGHASGANGPEHAEPKQAGKPTRGRWLSRLGLGDD